MVGILPKKKSQWVKYHGKQNCTTKSIVSHIRFICIAIQHQTYIILVWNVE